MTERDRPENETTRVSGSLRVRLLGLLARWLGVQFKIEGLPYGAPRSAKNVETDRLASSHSRS